MTSNVIRYHNAVVLLWAALALVTNPVLHGMSHGHLENHGDPTESTEKVQWTEQDVCPYCDAVSSLAELPNTEVHKQPLVLLWRIEPLGVHLANQYHLRSTRLRAPPVLA